MRGARVCVVGGFAWRGGRARADLVVGVAGGVGVGGVDARLAVGWRRRRDAPRMVSERGADVALRARMMEKSEGGSTLTECTPVASPSLSAINAVMSAFRDDFTT